MVFISNCNNYLKKVHALHNHYEEIHVLFLGFAITEKGIFGSGTITGVVGRFSFNANESDFFGKVSFDIFGNNNRVTYFCIVNIHSFFS